MSVDINIHDARALAAKVTKFDGECASVWLSLKLAHGNGEVASFDLYFRGEDAFARANDYAEAINAVSAKHGVRLDEDT